MAWWAVAVPRRRMQRSAVAGSKLLHSLFSLLNPDDQLRQTDVIVLVVNSACDHVFPRRKHVRLPCVGLTLGIPNAVLWKYRSELSGIHRNLRLTQCRRSVGRVDSNSYTPSADSILLHGD